MAKNVDRVGDSDAFVFHKFNHNDRGNPHPQYLLKDSGWSENTVYGIRGVGNGTRQGFHREYLGTYELWFRFIAGSTSAPGGFTNITLPEHLTVLGGVGMYAGSGTLTTSGGVFHPLMFFNAGGNGVRMMRANVPAANIDSMPAGNEYTGLIQVRVS